MIRVPPRPILSLLFLLATCLTAGPAFPDPVPWPPPGKNESCTVEKQQKAGEQCEECVRRRSKADGCKDYASRGFVHRCSARCTGPLCREVWCKQPASAAPSRKD